MSHWLERTELLIGSKNLNVLKNSHVLIVGLGGVGSFAAEFIARAGVGRMTIIDGDCFDETNINRQLMALKSTIGTSKTDELGNRLLDINPSLVLNKMNEFIHPERVWQILEDSKPDYVMDCIDSVSPKLEWIIACKRNKIKIITHLGAGGKLDPTKVRIGNLKETHNCKLGSHIKKRLKRKNVSFRGIKAVYSSELQIKSSLKMTDGSNFKKSYYGTISYMPALFGLFGASCVIEHFLKNDVY